MQVAPPSNTSTSTKPQHDPHIVLIILNTYMWGKQLFFAKNCPMGVPAVAGWEMGKKGLKSFFRFFSPLNSALNSGQFECRWTGWKNSTCYCGQKKQNSVPLVLNGAAKICTNLGGVKKRWGFKKALFQNPTLFGPRKPLPPPLGKLALCPNHENRCAPDAIFIVPSTRQRTDTPVVHEYISIKINSNKGQPEAKIWESISKVGGMCVGGGGVGPSQQYTTTSTTQQ